VTSLRLSPDNLPHPSRVSHKTWVARIAACAGGMAFGFQTRSVRQPPWPSTPTNVAIQSTLRCSLLYSCRLERLHLYPIRRRPSSSAGQVVDEAYGHSDVASGSAEKERAPPNVTWGSTRPRGSSRAAETRRQPPHCQRPVPVPVQCGEHLGD
jgi:hypothetical protein